MSFATARREMVSIIGKRKKKTFCETPLDAKRISFGIKYIALEAKN